MKKTIGLIGLVAALGFTGCVNSVDSPNALLLRTQSERFELNGNRIAVDYYGAFGNDTANDDYIVVKSCGHDSGYDEKGMFIGSGDRICVLGVELSFGIINDNDASAYNNILKLYMGEC